MSTSMKKRFSGKKEGARLRTAIGLVHHGRLTPERMRSAEQLPAAGLLAGKRRSLDRNPEAVGLVSDQAVGTHQHDARVGLRHFDHLLQALRVHPVIGKQHLAVLGSTVDLAESEVEVLRLRRRTQVGSPTRMRESFAA